MRPLHVETTGDGSDLVLVHGWGMHSGVWDEVVPALAARHRVHAVDLPGHGHSRGVLETAFEAAVERVAACVPPGAAVCAWSMGALIAQRLAQREPSRVSRLVLVSSTPCFALRPGWKCAVSPATIDSFAAWLSEDRDATLARFVALNALGGARGRESIRAFTARLGERGAPPAEALAAGLAWLRDVDLRAAAASIAQPTLLVHGARDQLAPVEAGRWLAAALPDARLLELDEAAHLPFFTHREAFVSALEAHLA